MNIIGISGLHNSVPFKKKEFPGLSPRHYRIAQGFDSAAALVSTGHIKAAAAEERFSGMKGTGSFPVNSIKYCLESASLSLDAIDYLAHGFAYEPYVSYYDHDEFTQRRYAEVYSREAQKRCIEEHFPATGLADKLIQVPHHLAHAASAFYVSGYDESLILVSDGMGEMHSVTVAIGHRDNTIEILKQIPALHSVGILYGIVTHYLGFDFGLDEYKVMGLAPYGNARVHFNKFKDFVHLKDGGVYTIPVLAADKNLREKETHDGVIAVLAAHFGPPRQPGSGLTQTHRDIAAALQSVLQAAMMHVLWHFKKETALNRLCMAGGVALNCTANGVIRRSRMFKDIFIQPAAGDDGSALGAALYTQHLHDTRSRFAKMAQPLWGPGYAPALIEEFLEKQSRCKATFFHSFDDLAQQIAADLAEGRIVGWFQGRMEFGPRALGNRSILADPRDPGMRDRVNQLIKQREDFRPFAPAVTAEAAARFFAIDAGDEATYAHMLFVTQVRAAYREQLPAVTHVDGSARVQTVSHESNPRFWVLLNEFEKLSGIPVLLNTSFNVRGQPIVRTPEEAMATFLRAGLDILVLDNYVVVRRVNQPEERVEAIDAV